MPLRAMIAGGNDAKGVSEATNLRRRRYVALGYLHPYVTETWKQGLEEVAIHTTAEECPNLMLDRRQHILVSGLNAPRGSLS
jgi:hypothetical protein